MGQVEELVYFGKVSENGYAEISANVLVTQGMKGDIIFPNLKGFIDTGAGITSIRKGIIEHKMKIEEYKTIERNSASGAYNSIQIPNVLLNFSGLLGEKWIPMEFIGTSHMGDNYDIIIGCDILHMCEFIYNGLSKTYFLKMYQSVDK